MGEIEIRTELTFFISLINYNGKSKGRFKTRRLFFYVAYVTCLTQHLVQFFSNFILEKVFRKIFLIKI